MVRFARYAAENFFSSPELDEMTRNNEDVPEEPLCIPDDPLDSIYMYPMEEVQSLLKYVDGSLDSPPAAEHDPCSLPTANLSCENWKEEKEEEAEAAGSRDIQKKKKRDSEFVSSSMIDGLSNSSSDDDHEDGKGEIYNGTIPKKKRNNCGRSHVWSVIPPVLPLACQKQSGDSEDDNSNAEIVSPESLCAIQRCNQCMAEDTPQWRQGPDGPGTLCNACGLRYRKWTTGRSSSRYLM